MKNFNLFEKCNRRIAKRVTLIAVLLAMCMPQLWGASNIKQYTRIYFDNSKANWNYSKVYLCANDEQIYEMSKIDNTKLYWHFRTDGDWNSCPFVRIIATSTSWSKPGGWTNIHNNAENATNTYDTWNYDKDCYNVIQAQKTGSVDDIASITVTYLGNTSAWGLNKTITMKAKVMAVNASGYSETNTPGALSASSYKFTADGSCSYGTSGSLAAGSASTTFEAGYTATTTLTAASVTNYQFTGWYDGDGTLISTDATCTVYPTTDATYYAYYAAMPTATLTLPNNSGSMPSPTSSYQRAYYLYNTKATDQDTLIFCPYVMITGTSSAPNWIKTGASSNTSGGSSYNVDIFPGTNTGTYKSGGATNVYKIYANRILIRVTNCTQVRVSGNSKGSGAYIKVSAFEITTGYGAATAASTATGTTANAVGVTTLSGLTAAKEYLLVIEGTNTSKDNQIGEVALFSPARSSCDSPAAPTISGTTAYTYGGTITLTASHNGSNHDASTTYRWLKGAAFGSAVQVQAAATGSSGYTFTKTAAIADAGTYWCEASNGEDCKSHNSSGCAITVAKADITPSVSYASVGGTTLTVGETSSGSPTISGNLGDGTVTYSSSDPSVASVDENTGVVTAVAAGTATITATIAATTNYNGGTATANFTINAACTTPTIAWSTAPANGTVGGNMTISVTSNYPAGVTITSNNSNATLTNRTVVGSTVSYQLNYAVAGGANITASVDGDGSTVCDETINLDAVAITVSKNTPTDFTVSGTTAICPGGNTDITLSGSQDVIDYQLYKGAATEGDAKHGTGSALTWNVSAAGTYTVRAVENATYAAATMSGNAVITVNTATSITTQPTTPVAATVGSACSITGLVAAGTSPTYQWQTCNSDGSSATNITAAGAMSFTNWTTATLGLTPTAAGATYYKCVVSGSCGDPVTSNVVTVNASAAPTLHTITYNANGGTCKASDTQASENAAITLATPTTTNDSTFKGWYINGELVTAATYRPTSDVTAYALWHKNCAGGGGTTTLSWFETSNHNPTNNKPDSESRYCYGYTNSAKTDSYAYTLTTDYGNSGAHGTANEDLYLHYGNHWNIYANNTTTGGTPTTFSNITSLSLKVKLRNTAPTMTITIGGTTIANAVSLSDANTSTFTKYTYNNLANLSGKITITNNGSGSTNYDIYIDDIEITTAGGGATCWHVTYLGGTGVDGGYVVDAAAYANNASATVKANSNPGFTREGYTFNGWQDGAGNSFTAGGSITMTKDTTLIAQWTSAVCAAPTITAQTEIQEIDLGERPEFSITATGAGSYQWYTCGADGSGEVVIDGATSSTYSPVAPTVVGTSYYKCKAIASCDASYVTYSDVIPCVVSPTNFTIHYETNTSTSSTNYDIEHFTQTKEVNSEVTSYITSLTNFAKTSGITISDKAKKVDNVVTMSGKISVLAAYDENEYLSYTFTVANNYYLSIDSIDIRCQPVGGGNRNFKVVLTDALGTTITGNISTTTSGVLNRIPFTSAELNGKKLVGTVTVKIYGWYTSEDTYRLARHSYIYGKVSSLPAPSVSWDSHPNTAMVGDGGKTYSITTDGTNSVTWTIEDQTGATGAALSGSDKSSRTLGSYSAAGTLYVQAAVTGDGSHYNSSLTTTLRQFVTIAPNCGTTTLISATLASGTTTGTVTGGTATVAFESSKELDGGYKMGEDGSYMYLTLGSGYFAEGDVVSVVITAAPNIPIGETPTLHIYKYMSSIWTELGSVRATEAGTYNYTLTTANTATDFNCIGLYRTGNNQNPYVKSMTVSRNDCSGSRPSSVSVSASADGPYDIDASVTLTVTATDATSYQWYSNTSNSTSGGTILEGRTSETYSPSTALAGTTYYYCVATNSYGSTASNVIDVTVSSTKADPSAVWTGTETSPVYGGGGYTVTVVAKDGGSGLWDGDLTADMLTAPTGVRLSGVTVNNTTKTITAQYGVTEAAESPIVFSLTLPETANHNSAELTFDDATFTTCSGDGGEGTSYKIRVRNYATSNISATNKFAWETPGAGRISGKISSSLSGNAKASTVVDVFDTICTTNIQDVWVQPFAAGVNKIRVYANYTVKENTVAYIYKMSTFINGDSKSAVTYSVVYNGDDEAANTGTTGYKYVDITLNEAMGANEIVRIHFSKNLNLTGAVVTVPGGGDGTRDHATTIVWLDEGSGTPASTVEKATIDADFKYAATKTGNANALASLGVISYSSSDVTVATVNATTGVVNIQGAGTTTIKATLAASGCYRKAELSYTLSVAASTCTDAAGTITASIGGTPIEGNTVNKEACETVRLTVSGHLANDGVSYQWKRNGASISGSDAYIDVTDGGDYTVDVTNTGDGHCTMPATNTITVNSASLSASAIVDKWYVKNGRRTPDVALVAIEGTTSWKVNDGTNNIWVVENGVLNEEYDDGFAGCQFELRDGIVYLKGTKTDGSAPSGLTAGNVTLTITAVNECGGADASANVVITKQAPDPTDKPQVAFVVTGTKGDPVNNVATSLTSERGIWTSLSTSYDLTGCNAYWTNNEKAIREYYSQFDAIVITDDPSTDEKPASGKKYVDALGTMVDVRPILTMEAFVGKYGSGSNWHIGGTPSSPNPRQYELKLQCKDHDIFSDLTPSANFRSEEIDGETYYYVTMVDNSVTPYAGLADDAETGTYPALQGFSAASIKGTGMLGIGTISNGTLQGGVERQDEPTARMMILGIQHQAMAALTSEGKQVIKNAINYLLKTDMEEVDDCSNYFIGATDSEWSKASNWSSGKVPDASTKARILVPVTISTKVHVAQVDIAVDGRSIHYNSGNTDCSGSVTIASTGALIVEGQVRRTTNGRLFTEDELEPTTPADLILQTSPSAQGALIFDNSDGETQATVTVHSSANKDGSTRNWQYLTSPLQETPVTEFFYGVGTYTYKHSEADGGWVRYNLGTTFHAFDAIGLTQNAAKDFVFYGPLAPTGEWELNLTKVNSGNNLFGNSWTAPIDLKALVRNTDFDSNIDLDLAIYNTGADKKIGEVFDQEANADNTPGTWHHVPLELATLEDAGWMGLKVIPAYQAFQLKATASATLTIDYDKCVRGSESKNYTEPLRAPRRRSAGRPDSEIEALRLAVSDANGVAYIYLLEGNQFTEGYDNGWELSYTANSKYGKLYAISPEQGNMMALARPYLEGTMVGFQRGQSNEYTITFNETQGNYYLNDLRTQQSTLIQEGESYTFTTEEGESENRFIISAIPFDKPGIATGVTDLDAEAPKVQKVIYNDKLYIIRGGKVFSADGQLVK